VVNLFLLKNIEKDLVGFSSLVEKDFPGYFLCSFAWCFSCDLGCYNIIVYG
jgi:hypothetical protein